MSRLTMAMPPPSISEKIRDLYRAVSSTLLT